MSTPAAATPVACLDVGAQRYHYVDVVAALGGAAGAARVPRSRKVLLENLLRHQGRDGDPARSVAALLDGHGAEIAFHPTRVLMQDLLAGPALVDLAALRDAVAAAGGDPHAVNPSLPVDLVIDHSLAVDAYAHPGAAARNADLDYRRNHERYAFFKWCQRAFENLRVVPPGGGIVHQVNVEHLAQVVAVHNSGERAWAVPDTLVGTDSHTPMVNALGVLGWGVGGIEAQAAMLGLPVALRVPPVVGVTFEGRLRAGVTATDLVLTVTERLRAHGVVGKFVECAGDGLERVPLADRATVANMAPEYGATCVYFPVDCATVDYLRFTGRDEQHVRRVEAYARAQGLWRDRGEPEPEFDERLCIDLAAVEPCLAGPRRPEDRVALSAMPRTFARELETTFGVSAGGDRSVAIAGTAERLGDGDVVIAALTSCTNTSNPAVMLAAGLLARNAVARGLARKPWVKTSLAPGSQVVRDYLDAAGLTPALDALGFHLVGFGCTTCGGFSGPLDAAVGDAVDAGRLVVAAVLSGNRNFDGRIHPQVRAGYLASPPLVVAYAIAGSVRLDLTREPLGTGADGVPVYLREIWPDDAEIQAVLGRALEPRMFAARYRGIFDGDARWRAVEGSGGARFAWDPASTYIRRPPYLDGVADEPGEPADLVDARVLAAFGDAITTDHISPSGAIAPDSPAGAWLRERQQPVASFNSYGSRRANHEVMVRGGFANIRLRNRLLPGREGGYTRHAPGGEVMSIFDAAERYRRDGVALVILAGERYGTGSSRDWAAKATALLGVRAVVALGFERIHRANLVGMGVLPLEVAAGAAPGALDVGFDARLSVTGIAAGLRPGGALTLVVEEPAMAARTVPVVCRIETRAELDYFRHGGILPYVYRMLTA